MGFPEAVRSVVSKYAAFSGRASRSEYWYWFLFTVLVNLATTILDVAIFPDSEAGPLNSIANIFFLIPGIAVTARRLHDTGRSGWWMLIVALPVIGWILLFVWTVTRSDPIANQFGEPPFAGTASA